MNVREVSDKYAEGQEAKVVHSSSRNNIPDSFPGKSTNSNNNSSQMHTWSGTGYNEKQSSPDQINSMQNIYSQDTGFTEIP